MSGTPGIPAITAGRMSNRPRAGLDPSAPRGPRPSSLPASGDPLTVTEGSAAPAGLATTPTIPARGTSVPPAGKGLAAGASPAPRGLTVSQLAVLGPALGDAIAHREPSGFCIDCEADASLCADHADDLDLASSYAALAAELGIELEDS